MFVSVLINNYNYADYLEDAVASVLRQSHGDFEIILVDDGSTDHSRDLIGELVRRDARVVSCLKANGGQLSAFNAGFARARGEVLFFLDADDRYHPDYLEKALAVYREHTTCDFLFCAYECFGSVNEPVLLDYPASLTDLGYTGLLTYHRRTWIGAPTSALSLRRSLAKRFFPIPFEEDWRICADECLILLASLYHGRKFCLNEPCLGYRTHGGNHFFGRDRHRDAELRRKLNAARLVARAGEDLGQYRYLGGTDLARLLLQEAATGNKNRRLLQAYAPVLEPLLPKPLLRPWRRHRKLRQLVQKAPLP